MSEKSENASTSKKCMSVANIESFPYHEGAEELDYGSISFSYTLYRTSIP